MPSRASAELKFGIRQSSTTHSLSIDVLVLGIKGQAIAGKHLSLGRTGGANNPVAKLFNLRLLSLSPVRGLMSSSHQPWKAWFYLELL